MQKIKRSTKRNGARRQASTKFVKFLFNALYGKVPLNVKFNEGCDTLLVADLLTAVLSACRRAMLLVWCEAIVIIFLLFIILRTA